MRLPWFVGVCPEPVKNWKFGAKTRKVSGLNTQSPSSSSPPGWLSKERLPTLAAAAVSLVWAALAILVSDPDTGELLFRGYFVQDADEVVRSWYGRCAGVNPYIIPYSSLSMPGWTSLLAFGEWIGAGLDWPLTLPGRLTTVLAAWLCLHNLAQWTRNVGGDWRMSLAAVVLVAASPAFFLLSISVYPSVALAALTVIALRYWSEERLLAAVLVIGWAPMIRWEGVLLVGLFAFALAIRQRWWKVGLVVIPYLIYLIVNALQFDNPLQPLIYRTTPHMGGAWRVFHPDVTWDVAAPAVHNLVTFWSPVVLVGGVLAGLWALLRHRKTLWMVALGCVGLTGALLSIHHPTSVWVLRIFATPWVLCVMAIVALVIRADSQRLRYAVMAVALIGVAVSIAMTFQKINAKDVPAAGRYRNEAGFHLFVRNADASEARQWLVDQSAEWIMINHLNANLMRADPTCSLYEKTLKMGSPSLSLTPRFRPLFGLPGGEGLLVFHTKAVPVSGCHEVKRFDESNLTVYRCRNQTTP
jgi:hypothetical protein